VVGALLALLAGLGLAQFPDTLSRLQATTKLQAAGVTVLLLAAALLAEDTAEVAVLLLVGRVLLPREPDLPTNLTSSLRSLGPPAHDAAWGTPARTADDRTGEERRHDATP
jgi:monovalent cation/proton antiporter MnhG/PhaG subunit